MPHIYTLFGLLNYTICIILFIYGILKREFHNWFHINSPGFITFQAENKLLNLEIELVDYRKKRQNKFYFFKLRRISLSPRYIYNIHMKRE